MQVSNLTVSRIVEATSGEFLVVAIVDSHEVPLTKRIDASQLAGVVYAKPNVMHVPPTACKFYPVRGAVSSYSAIYSTAAASTPGGVTGVDADHANWPSGVNQHKFDVDLHEYGFNHGEYVAIAFNIDDSINNNGLQYSFSCGNNPFDPEESILEGNDTDALSWVYNDNFQGGVVNGAKGPIGKTIVVVCRVVTASSAGKFICYNLNVRSVDPNNTNADTDTSFDPKIKNDG